jgi:uncharacterized membrane protein
LRWWCSLFLVKHSQRKAATEPKIKLFLKKNKEEEGKQQQRTVLPLGKTTKIRIDLISRRRMAEKKDKRKKERNGETTTTTTKQIITSLLIINSILALVHFRCLFILLLFP